MKSSPLAHTGKFAALLDQEVSMGRQFLLFVLIGFPYQYGFRFLSLADSLACTFIDASLYTLLLGLCLRLDLVRITLCFLALPYLLFFPGWLNLPAAIVFGAIFLYCLWNAITNLRCTAPMIVTGNRMVVFLMLAAWINISGIGGYGFQWADYDINNARLHDLVMFDWPLRYGENRNLVYYFGYFLPAAALGKITSVDIAIRSMYFLALAGAALALRWLAYLSGWRMGLLLTIIFILFGPLDILNLLYVTRDQPSPLSGLVDTFRNDDLDMLNFATGYKVKFFMGSYPGNSYQLFWSPQQLFAGWLCAALLMHLFLQQQYRHFLFAYTLLCLWGTLVMIALLPLVIISIIIALSGKHQRTLFSIPNIAGAGSLAIIFILFYLGGSTAHNPSAWLFDAVNWRGQYDLLLAFYLANWGCYALLAIPHITRSDIRTRTWFAALLLALVLLPLRIFGEWSDLLCRGSTVLMFLLLVFNLGAIAGDWQSGHRIRSTALVILLVCGSGTALLIQKVSIANYGETQPVQSLLDYPEKRIYPNFGPDDSLFNRWLRRTPANPQPVQ